MGHVSTWNEQRGYMKEYHKIHSIFKRDHKTGKFIFDDFAKKEFSYLYENTWLWDEKIDGTNIRINWDGANFKIGGRTDNAQIPASLYARINTYLNPDIFKEGFKDLNSSVTLYGEGYGYKIQKGGSLYKADGVDFILFDVKIGDFYLDKEDVEDVAKKLKMLAVQTIGSGSIKDAISFVSAGFNSTFGSFEAEGIVLRPSVQLFDKQGNRVISKLKIRDFRHG